MSYETENQPSASEHLDQARVPNAATAWDIARTAFVTACEFLQKYLFTREKMLLQCDVDCHFSLNPLLSPRKRIGKSLSSSQRSCYLSWGPCSHSKAFWLKRWANNTLGGQQSSMFSNDGCRSDDNQWQVFLFCRKLSLNVFWRKWRRLWGQPKTGLGCHTPLCQNSTTSEHVPLARAKTVSGHTTTPPVVS